MQVEKKCKKYNLIIAKKNSFFHKSWLIWRESQLPQADVMTLKKMLKLLMFFLITLMLTLIDKVNKIGPLDLYLKFCAWVAVIKYAHTNTSNLVPNQLIHL